MRNADDLAGVEDEVALTVLHTADWHLGHRFLMFDERDRKTLTRARLDAVERVFEQARSGRVDLVICAGDLFEVPNPERQWWQGLLDLLARTDPDRPILLLPGNHDALTSNSVYQPGHPFRQQLPAWVEVIDREDYVFELDDRAVVYGVPCRSRAGANDPTEALPERAPGDRRIRIGVVHGSTADIAGFEQNFPIAWENAARRGLDYLALGDTHGFRVVAAEPAPVVYPGTPEPTSFSEQDAGQVAMVFFHRHGVRPRVRARQVGYWRWRDETCRSLASLRRLLDEKDLRTTVLRLTLDFEVTLAEEEELEELLVKLEGNEAHGGQAGVLLLDKRRLRRGRSVAPGDFPDELPPVLRAAVQRLQRQAVDGPAGEPARRALTHLFKLVRARDGG